MQPAVLRDWVQQFVGEVVELLNGQTPIIYTGFYYRRRRGRGGGPESGLPAVGAELHARYSQPLVPAPWTNWNFWQYTSKGVIPGITVNTVDLDAFRTTKTDLNRLRLT